MGWGVVRLSQVAFQQGCGEGSAQKALDDSEVKSFEPYCLRNTALAGLAEIGL
jgi:hypothetical protein